MINDPSVDAMTRVIGTQDAPISKYELCVIVSKRTRQIIEQMQSTGMLELPGKEKEIAAACREIMEGKIMRVKD